MAPSNWILPDTSNLGPQQGVMSPYPMVVMVTQARHTASTQPRPSDQCPTSVPAATYRRSEAWRQDRNSREPWLEFGFRPKRQALNKAAYESIQTAGSHTNAHEHKAHSEQLLARCDGS